MKQCLSIGTGRTKIVLAVESLDLTTPTKVVSGLIGCYLYRTQLIWGLCWISFYHKVHEVHHKR